MAKFQVGQREEVESFRLDPGAEAKRMMMVQKARAAECLKDPDCEFILIAKIKREARDIEAAEPGTFTIVGMMAATDATLKKMLPEVLVCGDKIVVQAKMTSAEIRDAFDKAGIPFASN